MLRSPPSMKRIAMSSTYSTLASNGDGAGNFRLAPTSKPRSVGMSAAVTENASTILQHSAKVLETQPSGNSRGEASSIKKARHER